MVRGKKLDIWSVRAHSCSIERNREWNLRPGENAVVVLLRAISAVRDVFIRGAASWAAEIVNTADMTGECPEGSSA